MTKYTLILFHLWSLLIVFHLWSSEPWACGRSDTCADFEQAAALEAGGEGLELRTGGPIM